MKELLSQLDIVLKDAPDVSQPLVFQTATNGIKMTNYQAILAVLVVTDAGTGTAVTMKQGATSTVSTALSFTKYYYKADIATSNAWVEGTASSNTFTTGTDSKTGVYAIPITGDMLDKTQESEDMYVRMDCASAANATGVLFYVPYLTRQIGDPTARPAIA